jgi:tyrosinase
MLTNTSPNDPVFFLHHSNIDRIWAEWQDDITRRNEPFSWYPPQGTITFPDGSIIQGHNRNDHMKPWGTNGNTIENVLDYRSLKYKYE